jgi:hypothetical protein
MGRGIQLACEQCDFATVLYECVPALGEGAIGPAEDQSDWLCGHCLLPVRLPTSAANISAEALDRGEGPRCERCGTALLPFAVAQEELADAAHSRVVLDLATEREANGMIRTALASVLERQAAIESGDSTTLEALDGLAEKVAPGPETPGSGHSAAPLAHAFSLANLAPLVANAVDMVGAARVLQTRLGVSDRHIAALQACVDEEAHLPGVPCPQCGTARLIHWPLWD